MICSSVRRCVVFEGFVKIMVKEKTLPHKVMVLTVGLNTRWSSTFNMVKDDYIVRSVFQVLCQRIPEIARHYIMDSDWKAAMKYKELLEAFAAVTEGRSGSTYMTLSFTPRLFRKLKTKYSSYSTSNNPNVQDVAMAMKRKPEEYKALLVYPFAQLARILEPRIPSNMHEHDPLLHSYVVLEQKKEQTDTIASHSQTSNYSHKILMDFMDERSVDGLVDDEITDVLKATLSGHTKIDPLIW